MSFFFVCLFGGRSGRGRKKEVLGERGGGVRGGMHGTFTVGAEEVVVVEDGMVEVGEGAVARLR